MSFSVDKSASRICYTQYNIDIFTITYIFLVTRKSNVLSNGKQILEMEGQKNV